MNRHKNITDNTNPITQQISYYILNLIQPCLNGMNGISQNKNSNLLQFGTKTKRRGEVFVK